MRKNIIIALIFCGLYGSSFGQRFIPMNFTQPAVLSADAGRDTLVCKGHPLILGGNPSAFGGSGGYLYLWSPGEGLNDPTLANPQAKLNDTRSYVLTVTDAHGCQATNFISVKVDQCLGVTETLVRQPLTIFPNPSNGEFTIKGLSYQKGILQRVEVFNELGQVVYSRSFTEAYMSAVLDIDTKIKDPGIYYLKISLTDQLFSQRLIVR